MRKMVNNKLPAFNTGPTKFYLRRKEIDLLYRDELTGMYTRKELAEKYGFSLPDISRYINYKKSY